MDYNLPLNFKQQQREILNTITLKELNDLAKKVINKNKFYIVVVGDKKTIFDKINKLGLPVVELTTDGNMVK
jgi:zinc protease